MTPSPKLGARHSLEVIKAIRNGLLLDGGQLGEVLLPSREVEGQALAPGDSVLVTLYNDGQGRPMASLRTPRAQHGQVASLKVVSTSKVGAFVDWGMPKDLLLPFAEQKGPVREGDWVLVMITSDREGRLLASAQLDRFLGDTSKDYQQGDEVSLVAAHGTDLGYKVVVDNRYWGMIARQELRAPLRPGQRVTGYVQRLRDDGKLSLSLNPPGALKSEGLSEQILTALEKAGGELPLGDKSTPEAIFETFRCSKNAFKQAIGGLYKDRRIVIGKQSIRLADQD
ncbi:MAG: S1-like domain-containing RNA-binding protein [Pseudomonadales bacterium]|nr:S1-like domain-containing RNA-binding protein [Pseudomonadales bacterium]